jgi:hypothetical protein
MFLVKLNGLKTWATDVGSTYLEVETKEHVHIIAGAEFSTLEGHTHLLSLRHYMGFRLLDCAGMSTLLIASMTWDSLPLKWNLTSGCILLAMHVNTLECTLMI